MAERKPGPVKPPMIDLKAREPNKRPPRPVAAESAAAPEPVPQPTPEPTPQPAAAAGDAATAAASESAAAALAPDAAASTEAAAEAHVPTEAPARVEPARSAEPPRAAAAAASEAAPEAVAPRENTPRPTPEPAAAPKPAVGPRPAAASKPAAAPESAAGPEPAPRPRFDYAQLALAAAGGAVLGLSLALLLATLNLWPSPPADPRLEAIAALRADLDETRQQVTAGVETTTALAGRLEALAIESATQRDELAARITAVRDLAEANRLDPASLPQADLAPLRSAIDGLAARVDALAAGASPADAAALGQSFAALQADLRELAGRAQTLEARTGAAETQLASLAAAPGAQGSASPLPADLGARLRLPLLLSGLETALAAGRPFADELAGLARVVPDQPAPPTLSAAAPAGLMRPDALYARFETVLPGMLAARAGAGSGDWGRDALDWAKSMLAIRPAEERAGDDPDAVMSRLEAAMDRQDYAAAAVLFEALPLPMRTAAGEVPQQVAGHAAAAAFIAGLRSAALAEGATP